MDKDYVLFDLPLISENQQIYIDQCNELHKVLTEKLESKDSTWDYAKYNIFALASTSEPFWWLWKNLQNIIRGSIKTEDPAWMSGWLNFHDTDSVLDWHNHLGSTYHGYISIDPKNTNTIFDTGEARYSIENKAGQIYIGPSARLHKVEVNEPFEGKRITIGFDITLEKNVISANENEFNWMPIY